MRRSPFNGNLAALSLGVLSSVFAASALGAPTLFEGNISTQRAYSVTLAALVLDASGTGTATVMGAGPASFTVPATYLSGTNTSMTSVPGLSLPGVAGVTYLGAYLSWSNTSTGSFGPFLSPSATYTLLANTTAPPNLGKSPRTGYLRLKVGSQGFGGNMLLLTTGSYSGSRPGPMSTYYFYQYVMRFQGSGSLGGPAATTPIAITGSSTTTSNTVLVTAASTRAPWITGTVTARDYKGGLSFVHTATGMDSRNSAGTSGNISLVTPQMLNAFTKSGAVILNKRTQFASTSTLRLSFLPETGRGALLASGMLGLFALTPLQRRRIETR